MPVQTLGLRSVVPLGKALPESRAKVRSLLLPTAHLEYRFWPLFARPTTGVHRYFPNPSRVSLSEFIRTPLLDIVAA
jgi:hypothetical protein